jgi:hypothetical protein
VTSAAVVPGRPLPAGVGTALVGGALVGASYLGRPALAAVIGVVQVVAALAWLALLDARGGRGATLIALGAAAAGDALVATAPGTQLGRVAGVVGVALLAAFLHQLARRPRPGVGASLSATMSAVLLGAAGTALLAMRGGRGGREAVVAAVLGSAAALVVARLADAAIARPLIVPAGTRGWPGAVLGVLASVAVGAVYGGSAPPLTESTGVRIAVAAALLGLVADLVVDAARAGLPPDVDERRRSAVLPLAVLLPALVAGPTAYVAGRILLG